MNCNAKARDAAFTGENFGKWATSRGCRSRVTTKRIALDGTTIACYCKRHTPTGNASLALVAVDATDEEMRVELERVREFDRAFMARVNHNSKG